MGSALADMTPDEREAEFIIRRWVHRKTGVSHLERGMWKFGEDMRRAGEAADKAFGPMLDFIEKGTR